MVREKLNDKQIRVGKLICEDYLALVTKRYFPLFEELGKIATDTLSILEMGSLELSPHHLTFRGGHFYKNRTKLDLSNLPKVYSEHDERESNGKGNYVSLDIHQAMKMAFDDFREKVRGTLAARVD